jgi:hypothetical protein
MPLDEHNLTKVAMILTRKSLSGEQQVIGQCEHHTPAKWDNYERNATYNQCLDTKLKMAIPPNREPGNVQIQTSVDHFVTDITRTIHSAAYDPGCTQKRKNTPRSSWCPRLAQRSKHSGGVCGTAMDV